MVSRVRMTYRQGSPREGSSCDMSIAERRLGVDALSTGGDLLSHLEVLGGQKYYMANTMPCTALSQRAGLLDFSKQMSLPQAQLKSIPRVDRPGHWLCPH